MMKINLSLLVLFIVFLFFSCDKTDEITSRELDTIAGVDFEVNIAENDPSTFSTSILFSLGDYPDISDYLNRIQEVQVNSVTYAIRAYDSPVANDVLFSGTLKLDAINIFLDKVNVRDMYQTGVTQALDLTDQDLSDLARTLESSQSISGSLAGEVTGKPVNFQVYVEFDLTLRVGA
jgi:hypothetical protein